MPSDKHKNVYHSIMPFVLNVLSICAARAYKILNQYALRSAKNIFTDSHRYRKFGDAEWVWVVFVFVWTKWIMCGLFFFTQEKTAALTIQAFFFKQWIATDVLIWNIV